MIAMISHRSIFIVMILTMTTCANNTVAEPLDLGPTGGWEFSINVANVTWGETTESSFQSNPVIEFIVLSKKTAAEQATIIPLIIKSKSFDNESMQNYLENEMKSRNLSDTSFHLQKMANAIGIVGKGYNNKNRLWEFLAFFPVWPTDSSSDRAVLIVSTLTENSSALLFDTIQVKQCPGRLPFFPAHNIRRILAI